LEQTGTEVAEPNVPTVIVPSVVRLASPAPELVRARVVLDPSIKSKVKVPAAVWLMLLPTFTKLPEESIRCVPLV